MEAGLSSHTNQAEAMLLSSPKLPSFRGVTEMVEELEDLSVTDVTGVFTVLSNDGPLAKEVLRMVNSPLYELPRQIASLREAVMILGVAKLQNLALALSYVSRFRGEVVYRRGVDFLWQTSLMTGVASRQLAQVTEQWDEEEAFLAGLLADCGVLVMYRVMPGYRDVVERFRLGEGDLIDLERESMPTDHARVADRFLATWDFPDRLRALLSAQHDPELMGLNANLLPCANILKAAWLCARSLTVPAFEWESKWISQRTAEVLGVGPSNLKGLALNLQESFERTATLFDIPVTRSQSGQPV